MVTVMSEGGTVGAGGLARACDVSCRVYPMCYYHCQYHYDYR